ncbi:hypothetical protein C8F04DRAFT_1239948 [Mycena alexandri]|uniref:Uncharacterized protein n=1 Tax=Mycena alexandri TaxID=1745969 RepID=A0AAD6SCT8_9AGAR|nr:hypothetical protein C8F04DRAFT_1239948 [Mycena alexandri]
MIPVTGRISCYNKHGTQTAPKQRVSSYVYPRSPGWTSTCSLMRRGAGSPKKDIQDNSTRRSTPKEDGETYWRGARHDATANPAQTRRESAPSCADPPRGLDFRPLQKAWRDLKGRAAGVLMTRVNNEDVGEKGGRVPGPQPQRPSLYLPNPSYSSKLKFRRGNRVYARSDDDGVPIARRHLGGNPSETRFELKTLTGSHPIVSLIGGSFHSAENPLFKPVAKAL